MRLLHGWQKRMKMLSAKASVSRNAMSVLCVANLLWSKWTAYDSSNLNYKTKPAIPYTVVDCFEAYFGGTISSSIFTTRDYSLHLWPLHCHEELKLASKKFTNESRNSRGQSHTQRATSFHSWHFKLQSVSSHRRGRQNRGTILDTQLLKPLFLHPKKSACSEGNRICVFRTYINTCSFSKAYHQVYQKEV